MTAQKGMTPAEFYAAILAWLFPRGTWRVTENKPDPLVEFRSHPDDDAAYARMREYMALTMVERYGEYGPPS